MPSDVLSFEMPLMRHRGKTKMPSRNSRGHFCIRYEQPNDAVNAYCKKVNKFSYGESPRGAQPYNIIPESDVYRLIMRSNLPNAERFQDWVTEDVLPSS